MVKYLTLSTVPYTFKWSHEAILEKSTKNEKQNIMKFIENKETKLYSWKGNKSNLICYNNRCLEQYNIISNDLIQNI